MERIALQVCLVLLLSVASCRSSSDHTQVEADSSDNQRPRRQLFEKFFSADNAAKSGSLVHQFLDSRQPQEYEHQDFYGNAFPVGQEHSLSYSRPEDEQFLIVPSRKNARKPTPTPKAKAKAKAFNVNHIPVKNEQDNNRQGVTIDTLPFVEKYHVFNDRVTSGKGVNDPFAIDGSPYFERQFVFKPAAQKRGPNIQSQNKATKNNKPQEPTEKTYTVNNLLRADEEQRSVKAKPANTGEAVGAESRFAQYYARPEDVNYFASPGAFPNTLGTNLQTSFPGSFQQVEPAAVYTYNTTYPHVVRVYSPNPSSKYDPTGFSNRWQSFLENGFDSGADNFFGAKKLNRTTNVGQDSFSNRFDQNAASSFKPFHFGLEQFSNNGNFPANGFNHNVGSVSDVRPSQATLQHNNRDKPAQGVTSTFVTVPSVNSRFTSNYYPVTSQIKPSNDFRKPAMLPQRVVSTTTVRPRNSFEYTYERVSEIKSYSNPHVDDEDRNIWYDNDPEYIPTGNVVQDKFNDDKKNVVPPTTTSAPTTTPPQTTQHIPHDVHQIYQDYWPNWIVFNALPLYDKPNFFAGFPKTPVEDASFEIDVRSGGEEDPDEETPVTTTTTHRSVTQSRKKDLQKPQNIVNNGGQKWVEVKPPKMTNSNNNRVNNQQHSSVDLDERHHHGSTENSAITQVPPIDSSQNDAKSKIEQQNKDLVYYLYTLAQAAKFDEKSGNTKNSHNDNKPDQNNFSGTANTTPKPIRSRPVWNRRTTARPELNTRNPNRNTRIRVNNTEVENKNNTNSGKENIVPVSFIPTTERDGLIPTEKQRVKQKPSIQMTTSEAPFTSITLEYTTSDDNGLFTSGTDTPPVGTFNRAGGLFTSPTRKPTATTASSFIQDRKSTNVRRRTRPTTQRPTRTRPTNPRRTKVTTRHPNRRMRIRLNNTITENNVDETQLGEIVATEASFTSPTLKPTTEGNTVLFTSGTETLPPDTFNRAGSLFTSPTRKPTDETTEKSSSREVKATTEAMHVKDETRKTTRPRGHRIRRPTTTSKPYIRRPTASSARPRIRRPISSVQSHVTNPTSTVQPHIRRTTASPTRPHIRRPVSSTHVTNPTSTVRPHIRRPRPTAQPHIRRPTPSQPRIRRPTTPETVFITENVELSSEITENDNIETTTVISQSPSTQPVESIIKVIQNKLGTARPAIATTQEYSTAETVGHTNENTRTRRPVVDETFTTTGKPQPEIRRPSLRPIRRRPTTAIKVTSGTTESTDKPDIGVFSQSNGSNNEQYTSTSRPQIRRPTQGKFKGRKPVYHFIPAGKLPQPTIKNFTGNPFLANIGAKNLTGNAVFYKSPAHNFSHNPFLSGNSRFRRPTSTTKPEDERPVRPTFRSRARNFRPSFNSHIRQRVPTNRPHIRQRVTTVKPEITTEIQKIESTSHPQAAVPLNVGRINVTATPTSILPDFQDVMVSSTTNLTGEPSKKIEVVEFYNDPHNAQQYSFVSPPELPDGLLDITDDDYNMEIPDEMIIRGTPASEEQVVTSPTLYLLKAANKKENPVDIPEVPQNFLKGGKGVIYEDGVFKIIKLSKHKGRQPPTVEAADFLKVPEEFETATQSSLKEDQGNIYHRRITQGKNTLKNKPNKFGKEFSRNSPHTERKKKLYLTTKKPTYRTQQSVSVVTSKPKIKPTEIPIIEVGTITIEEITTPREIVIATRRKVIPKRKRKFFRKYGTKKKTGGKAEHEKRSAKITEAPKFGAPDVLLQDAPYTKPDLTGDSPKRHGVDAEESDEYGDVYDYYDEEPENESDNDNVDYETNENEPETEDNTTPLTTAAYEIIGNRNIEPDDKEVEEEEYTDENYEYEDDTDTERVEEQTELITNALHFSPTTESDNVKSTYFSLLAQASNEEESENVDNQSQYRNRVETTTLGPYFSVLKTKLPYLSNKRQKTERPQYIFEKEKGEDIKLSDDDETEVNFQNDRNRLPHKRIHIRLPTISPSDTDNKDLVNRRNSAATINKANTNDASVPHKNKRIRIKRPDSVILYNPSRNFATPSEDLSDERDQKNVERNSGEFENRGILEADQQQVDENADVVTTTERKYFILRPKNRNRMKTIDEQENENQFNYKEALENFKSRQNVKEITTQATVAYTNNRGRRIKRPNAGIYSSRFSTYRSPTTTPKPQTELAEEYEDVDAQSISQLTSEAPEQYISTAIPENTGSRTRKTNTRIYDSLRSRFTTPRAEETHPASDESDSNSVELRTVHYGSNPEELNVDDYNNNEDVLENIEETTTRRNFRRPNAGVYRPRLGNSRLRFKAKSGKPENAYTEEHVDKVETSIDSGDDQGAPENYESVVSGNLDRQEDFNDNTESSLKDTVIPDEANKNIRKPNTKIYDSLRNRFATHQVDETPETNDEGGINDDKNEDLIENIEETTTRRNFRRPNAGIYTPRFRNSRLRFKAKTDKPKNQYTEEHIHKVETSTYSDDQGVPENYESVVSEDLDRQEDFNENTDSSLKDTVIPDDANKNNRKPKTKIYDRLKNRFATPQVDETPEANDEGGINDDKNEDVIESIEETTTRRNFRRPNAGIYRPRFRNSRLRFKAKSDKPKNEYTEEHIDKVETSTDSNDQRVPENYESVVSEDLNRQEDFNENTDSSLKDTVIPDEANKNNRKPKTKIYDRLKNRFATPQVDETPEANDEGGINDVEVQTVDESNNDAPDKSEQDVDRYTSALDNNKNEEPKVTTTWSRFRRPNVGLYRSRFPNRRLKSNLKTNQPEEVHTEANSEQVESTTIQSENAKEYGGIVASRRLRRPNASIYNSRFRHIPFTSKPKVADISRTNSEQITLGVSSSVNKNKNDNNNEETEVHDNSRRIVLPRIKIKRPNPVQNTNSRRISRPNVSIYNIRGRYNPLRRKTEETVSTTERVTTEPPQEAETLDNSELHNQDSDQSVDEKSEQILNTDENESNARKIKRPNLAVYKRKFRYSPLKRLPDENVSDGKENEDKEKETEPIIEPVLENQHDKDNVEPTDDDVDESEVVSKPDNDTSSIRRIKRPNPAHYASRFRGLRNRPDKVADDTGTPDEETRPETTQTLRRNNVRIRTTPTTTIAEGENIEDPTTAIPDLYSRFRRVRPRLPVRPTTQKPTQRAVLGGNSDRVYAFIQNRGTGQNGGQPSRYNLRRRFPLSRRPEHLREYSKGDEDEIIREFDSDFGRRLR